MRISPTLTTKVDRKEPLSENRPYPQGIAMAIGIFASARGVLQKGPSLQDMCSILLINIQPQKTITCNLPIDCSLHAPPHPTLKPAPPNSTASISSSVQAILPNLAGNSLLSHTSPVFGSILPNSCPECPPIPPYACEPLGGGADDEDDADGDDDSGEEGRL